MLPIAKAVGPMLLGALPGLMGGGGGGGGGAAPMPMPAGPAGPPPIVVIDQSKSAFGGGGAGGALGPGISAAIAGALSRTFGADAHMGHDGGMYGAQVDTDSIIDGSYDPSVPIVITMTQLTKIVEKNEELSDLLA